MLQASDFSKRAQAVQPSATLAVSKKAKQMAAEGIDVINLGVGEPDFTTPKAISEAAIEAIEGGQTSFYTPVGGILPLREAIAEQTTKKTGQALSANQVTVTSGAKLSLYTIMQVLLNPGDQVVMPEPYWVSYVEQVRLAGGVATTVKPKTAAMKLTPADLDEVAGPVKLIILNNPSNPTGQVYSRAEVQALLDWADAHDSFLLSDEIYGQLVYNGQTFTSALSLQAIKDSRLIIVNGVSKSYSMTGWRLGWTIADEKIIAEMNKLLGHMTSNPAAVSQYAALAALTVDQQMVEDMRTTFESRLNATYDKLTAIPGLSVAQKPEGAFYLFFKVDQDLLDKLGLKSTIDFATALLEQAHVAIPAGEGFGMPGYLRLSYAKDQETINEALDRILAFVQ
ncbi:pyridoxal phosphate-dependent aminotransferase [Fructobacillus evanidus]|uniref:Aminotransferase n=1 Tax=Fructobacillus evanidus TaxID=3064281 RepID=A0ABN9YL08_9LACO|nr:Aspartate/methionine/tyrosine aminotransferase (AspB) [Fructobacillus sp. LMG 32999]CAK1222473.1 Aspartate/methionine/tyrosine aminotransferase (AspB) [Fructobacillus sp. LMG 32999]CAK1224304.1 Aspartate/methionine/tyrosine aminotransferase (AspB) [Fructobacillus sp. LMG 32999]CAK1224449.1 Aspartate/methionine/tyrosine aminotransferase (AspB) [Fructobacillus sp. LMG 32999]CAK1224606.1 Aspartate/methionine/tyrosine aminotransferase (AspB) [Fructobacillus sp. LMG 32999]